MWTGGRSSAVARGVLRSLPGWVDRRTGSSDEAAGRIAGLDELRTRGLASLGRLVDADDCAELQAFARTAPGRGRRTDGEFVRCTYATRPDHSSAFFPSVGFMLANPQIQALMADPRILALAESYLGAAPVVQVPTLYWTFPSPALDADLARRSARWFHVDFDGLAAVRVHVNLTDVDEGAGPMEYVWGSHDPKALRGRGMSERDEGLPEELVAARFGSSATHPLCGPAGSVFVSDSQGLHRGTPPRATERLFLVIAITAGSFATYTQRRRSVPVHDAAFGALAGNASGPLRLFPPAPAGESVARLEEPSAAVVR